MNAEPEPPVPQKPVRKCAICEKPAAGKYLPFCSKRCADVDLARWVNGGYAVPSSAPEDIEEAVQAAQESNHKTH